MVFDQNQVDLLQGSTVFDSTGDKVGKVSDVYFDDATNVPSWVTVNTGLFGSRTTFVPLNAADLRGDELHVPFEKGFIKDAPNLDVDEHLSEQEEDRLYQYYSLQRDGRTDRDFVDTDRTRTDVRDRDLTDRNVRTGDADSMTLHEERVNVGTERVETGRMRLRKRVVTEQKTVTVPVEREEYELVREPLSGKDAVGDGKLGEDEVVVTTHETRPVVNTETVATERVGLQAHTVTDQQNITTNVSREEAELVQDGDRTVRNGDVRDGSVGDKLRDDLHGDFNHDGVRDSRQK